MNMNTHLIPIRNTVFPFYTTSSYFTSLIDKWTNDRKMSVEVHEHESSLLQRLYRNRPQVVIFGVEGSLLHKGLISRIANTEHRPVIVSLIQSPSESELTECYAQGADRVVAVPDCSAKIFRALLGRLVRNEQFYPPYHIQQGIQTIKFAESEVRLTKKTFDVAQYLFANHGLSLIHISEPTRPY